MEHPHLSLEYVLRRPAVDTKEPPVLILLHGYGSNESDLFGLSTTLPPSLLVISARAPYVLSESQYAWFSLDFSTGKPVGDSKEAEQSRLQLKKFVDEVAETFMVDRTQIFLAGFSQGAIMSGSVALTFPSLVKGIAMLSGRILPEIKSQVGDKSALKDLHVFLAHGTDDTVLSIRHARDAREYLEEQGVDLEYAEYPIAHAISDEETRALVMWLKNTLAVPRH